MTRIANCFTNLAKQNRKGLITYIVAGDPSLPLTLPLMRALVEGGADLIELGVPFSDPMADGPVIQRACERALINEVSLSEVIGTVAEFRQENQTVPVVLMGYLNPVEIMGYATFVQAAATAGVDGVLLVDMPPEESHALRQLIKQQGMDLIFLLAPTTKDARLQYICQVASGFLYYVSLKGVTGSDSLQPESLLAPVSRIRQCTDLPVAIGFGVRDPASAQSVAKAGDAVVLGSRIIELVHETADDSLPSSIVKFLTTIRRAIDVPATF